MKIFSIIAVLLAVVAYTGAPNAFAAQSTAPATFRVLLDTSKGPVVIVVERRLAPHGADRFYQLVKAKYFDGARFYRVVPGFVVQWGGAANPAMTKKWSTTIPDDPPKASNTRGAVTFAASSEPNSRSTHLFINLGNNARLDGMGFAPIGRVTSGMSNVDHIYSGYGEQPDQDMIAEQGNVYLKKEFPKLDYIKTARIVSP
ncbi:MAG TPA: peptidylprolyl isomerase [Candidatus Cybelea sp.]|nr:peptidylprolyl isomerase [Candidatus Cybelea sp.]